MDRAKRGPYAKGKARRKEILKAALSIVAKEGFDQTTLSKISKAVGISDVAVLHYFGTMDDLLVEVLKQRDTDDMAAATSSLPDMVSQMIQLIAHPEQSIKQVMQIVRRNSQTPGLVELYAHMSVRASDPTSPAYRYFKQRGKVERYVVGSAAKKVIDKEHLDTELSPEEMARVMQALLDGLQIQWLIDRDIDMADIAEKAIKLMWNQSQSTNKSKDTSDEIL
ncbi:MAG: TetR/AcrR family transcriptional regulator [Bifidobacterium sp.]|jgi:AcrR family transcriptional regulator|nr:TetR/AcrR family transcriptional regulator [Bifidobacterium sp.]MCH4174530.1 TetR/AcrR family transcriptional regulator [Bifidobacterium sp.]